MINPRLNLSTACLAFSVIFVADAKTETVRWEGSSGQTPGSSCWSEYIDPNGTVTFGGGAMTISTSSDGQNVYWYQSGSQIAFPPTIVFEARVKFLSGSTSHVSRAPVVILIETAPLVGTMLCVGADDVFILSDDITRGASAVVDTDGGFHTYRVIITGSSVSVEYDGAPLLSGSTFFNGAGFFAGTERFLFGEGTSYAYGSSAWEYVEHNSGSDPCGPVPVRSTTWGAVKALYR
jgi:hypothetical protein